MSISIVSLKASIANLYKKNRDLAIKKSLMNCHIEGMHSIVLGRDSDGSLIRMFVTQSRHGLIHPGDIAFHMHRHDLELVVVEGAITNWLLKPFLDTDQNIQCDRYRFSSKLDNGVGGFELVGKNYIGSLTSESYSEKESITLKADEYHSMTIEKGKGAAWLVIKGRKNKDYVPLVYSPHNLVNWSAEGLYEPFASETLDHLMTSLVEGSI